MKILTLKEIDGLWEFEKELSEEEHVQYIVSKGFHSQEFFSDYFLMEWKTKQRTGEFVETPEFHREIWKNLDLGIDLNIIIARAHGKTTAVLIWIMHALLYKKETDILYIASKGLGEKGVARIKAELESNKLILKCFGLMKPKKVYKKDGDTGKRWTMSLLQLENGTNLETKSAGQKIRGDRPTKILHDDPQENKDVLNKDIVDKFNLWAFTSLYNTLMPGGSMCALGTIIGNLCFVKYLRDKKQWFTIEYEACDENFENILWPEMWNEEELRKRRDGYTLPNGQFQLGIGTVNFNQEFRNISINRENTIIKEFWIRYWSILPEKFDYIIMAIDPADGEKETGDFIGICVVGVFGGKYYVLHSKGYKESALRIPMIARMLFEKFGVNVIIYEKNKEASIGKMLEEDELPVHMHHAHKDKTTRLLTISPKIEGEVVFFQRNGENDELIYQLTNFPDVAHDDEMDAFIYCISAEYNAGGGVTVC